MMTLSQAARFAQGRLVGADGEVSRVITDSRLAQPGDLFVALKGERFDAHDFVAEVVARGAAALVRDGFELAGASLIQAGDDTRLALGRLAAGWRETQPAIRIGVTGSNGKTTVKEMLAAILRAHAGADAVLATAGNFNNDIGLPLTLLQLKPQHRYAVIEMGMNHHGELSYLTGLTRPQVALVNNAMRAHFGHFGSTEDVARAKAEIFEGLIDGGVAVVNADDANLPLFRAAAGSHRQLSFGLGLADVSARDLALSALDSRFTLVSPAGQLAVSLPAPGEHNVRNALAAAAVALALEVPLAAIARGLAAFGGAKGRLQIKRSPRGLTVIDDSYNANPDSMKAGIDVLAGLPGPRCFVMGDIGELGEAAPALHAEVGEHARLRGIEQLFALGEASRRAVQAFGGAGQGFDSIDELLECLDSRLASGTAVLVKGSRFMRMERVVEHLMQAKKEGV
ncbi:UDP-N-acetylmuramoyl-tripeptide--D-alanyl-D-alanine ligase [Chromobacterium violaceum]|uniref:UDP-N-acetylmuramoyl-tripeptide--D-alanyl-D-alanine ligase n=1 Tax=Chromobacterium violaceum TaxID=536 RepID=A0A202BF24_CHRVL|nr:UDP-N-acetylmuramoyl-tripeptide--D-alanyl-D-alanine ligase [Chromobacterium violaceum]MBA8733615.1 UDP-N-acetylmuramoyl-tripeptide--D-alanyl-D-alanine ligase [Chromobacterium violaceum]OVE50078.1 UDP-N-acetylmuramoyl-tripeptide--D-alanyl-D-alanine ligase [Chromobacterium violaceum]